MDFKDQKMRPKRVAASECTRKLQLVGNYEHEEFGWLNSIHREHVKVVDLGGSYGNSVFAAKDFMNEDAVSLFVGTVMTREKGKGKGELWQMEIPNTDLVVVPNEESIDCAQEQTYVGHIIQHSTTKENVELRIIQPHLLIDALKRGDTLPAYVKGHLQRFPQSPIVVVHAIKDITSGQELFLDYGYTHYDFGSQAGNPS